MKKDNINPAHYRKGAIECIEAIETAVSGKDALEGYLVGNIIKYLWRYENKNGLEDVKKAQWYLNKLIDTIDKREQERENVKIIIEGKTTKREVAEDYAAWLKQSAAIEANPTTTNI